MRRALRPLESDLLPAVALGLGGLVGLGAYWRRPTVSRLPLDLSYVTGSFQCPKAFEVCEGQQRLLCRSGDRLFELAKEGGCVQDPRLRELLGSCFPKSCLEEQRLQEVAASEVRSLDAAATQSSRLTT